MKHIFFLTFLVMNLSVNAQTIAEAKEFIKQQIEFNPPSDLYTQGALFCDYLGDKLATSFTDANYPKQDFPKTIVCTQELKMSTGDLVVQTINVFNVAGINNIVVKSESFYTQIIVFIKEGYANKKTTLQASNQGVKTENMNRAVLYIKSDQSLGDRIAKSLYFLCKQYGGSPREQSSF